MVALVLSGVLLASGESGSTGREAARDEPAATSRPAPPLAGIDAVTGDPVSLAQFKRRPVVVNVWASWCPACEKEARALARFARRHPKIALLGLAVQDTSEDATAYYRRWNLKHPTILDPEGAQAALLGVTGLPETIFLGRDHRIVTRVNGPASFEELESALDQARHAS